MIIEAGQHLLHYRLIEKIGEGGMGIVWRAADTTLDREVAIKVLPAAFAAHPERLARFEREAKLLASLNHPNIAAVFGLHEIPSTGSGQAGLRFLAMELVPGEDLAKRLRRGRLTASETLEVAGQIASGLEAAHDRGVVHRDLKPANVVVTADGAVKVLDFGLAKVVSASSPDSDPSDLPTATSVGSVIGAPIGTAPYMSPEQARGQDVDERCDVWAFGCVLWECLTGRALFGRSTSSDALAAVLGDDPDEQQLPSDTPPSVRRVLKRCLAKDPRRRYHHIADARIDLDEADDAAAPHTAERRPRTAIAWLSVALAASLVALVLSLSRSPGRVQPDSRYDNPLAGARFSKITDFPGSEFDAAISPDGRFVAFVSDAPGTFEILVGPVAGGNFSIPTAEQEDIALRDVRAPVRSVGFNHDGTELWFGGGTNRRVQMMPLLGGSLRPFLVPEAVSVDWSPDGDRVVYHTRDPGDPLYVADRDASNERLILANDRSRHQHHPAWSVDGHWIYLVRGRPPTLEMSLWRVSPDGGEPERLTHDKLDVQYPTPLDERTVLYSARDASGAGPWLWAIDVETRVSRRLTVGFEQYSSVSASADRSRLVATVQHPRAALWSVPILDRVATERDAEPYAELEETRALAPRIAGDAMFFLSSRGSDDGLWSLRDGEISEIWKGSETALFEPAAVSPDGRWIVLLLRRETGWHLHLLSADGAELRVLSGTFEARGTADWSPDGQWIVVGGSHEGVTGLYKIPADGGAPERIVEGDALDPVWSPDGDLIVYGGVQVQAVLTLEAVRPDGTPVEIPEIKVLRAGERMRFLPDGSGLVYMKGTEPSQDFWLLDLATMQSRRLTRLDPGASMRTFDVTPDGRRILFDRIEENSDIVLIELSQGR